MVGRLVLVQEIGVRAPVRQLEQFRLRYGVSGRNWSLFDRGSKDGDYEVNFEVREIVVESGSRVLSILAMQSMIKCLVTRDRALWKGLEKVARYFVRNETKYRQPVLTL